MIEEKIDKLIAAVERLTDALNARRDSDIPCDDAGPSEESNKLAALVDRLAPLANKPAEEPAPKPKKAKAPKAEEPKPEPAPEPEPAPAPAPEPAKPAVSLQDIRNAAQQALDNGKLNEVVAINKAYGLKRISDASADQYAEILAKLEAINGQA